MAPVSRPKSVTRRENQFSQAAKLELECARLSASEAQLNELLQQMRAKVREFRVQDSLNRREADAELARLSDDLQRSLYSQHALEARVQRGRDELSEISCATAACMADRDKAEAQRLAHTSECLRLKGRVAEERHEKELCQTRLHEVELERTCITDDIDALNVVTASLTLEKEVLQTKVTYQRHLDRVELCVMQRCEHLIVSTTFKQWVLVSPLSRNRRQACAHLQQRCIIKLIVHMISMWKYTARRCTWIRRRESTLILALLQVVLSQWYLDARQVRNQGRALCARCLQGWYSVSLNLRRLRKHLAAKTKTFLREGVSRWRTVAQRMYRSRRLSQSLGNFCRRRFLGEVIQSWATGSRLIQQRRCSTLVFHRHSRVISLRCSMRHLRRRCNDRRHSTCASAQIQDRCHARLGIRILQMMRQVMITRQKISQAAARLSARLTFVANPDARPILLKSFQAFCDFMNPQLPLVFLHAARRRRLLEVANQLILEWRDATLCRHAEVEASARIRERHCRISIRDWHSHARELRLSAMRELAIHRIYEKPLAFLTRRPLLRWWSRYTTREQLLASRKEIISRRQKLALCMWAFSLWGSSVRRTLHAEYVGLLEKLAAISQVEAEFDLQKKSVADVCAKMELGRQHLLREVYRKSQVAADLRVQLQETEASNVMLLGCVEGEQKAAEELTREVHCLSDRHAMGGWERDLERIEALEFQLAESLEEQGALRFSLLRCGAEANHALQKQCASETEAKALQRLYEESKRDYDQSLESLDAKAASLVRDGRAVQQKVNRLEKELAGVSFRMRMRDLELQRWEVTVPKSTIANRRGLQSDM